MRKRENNEILSLESEVCDSSIGKPITKGQLKVNENKIDTGAQAVFTKLNEEDVTEIKESTKVNYPSLKEGTSCFVEFTCFTGVCKVEVYSPQALKEKSHFV